MKTGREIKRIETKVMEYGKTIELKNITVQ